MDAMVKEFMGRKINVRAYHRDGATGIVIRLHATDPATGVIVNNVGTTEKQAWERVRVSLFESWNYLSNRPPEHPGA